jgi:RNA polymerase sigma factor for flagellar operon FliA
MKQDISKFKQGFDGDESNKINAHFMNEIVIKYESLVKSIVRTMAIRIHPKVRKEELISAGMLGLINALLRFDPQKGVRFETYAQHRIKGSILDELRKIDWVPRSVRRGIRRIEEAKTAASLRLGREATDMEIAQEMGVDLIRYYKMLHRAQGVHLSALDDRLFDGSDPFFDQQPIACLIGLTLFLINNPLISPLHLMKCRSGN